MKISFKIDGNQFNYFDNRLFMLYAVKYSISINKGFAIYFGIDDNSPHFEFSLSEKMIKGKEYTTENSSLTSYFGLGNGETFFEEKESRCKFSVTERNGNRIFGTFEAIGLERNGKKINVTEGQFSDVIVRYKP